ncbi:TPA: replication protein [Mannheimia haemolytica]|uniref:replication protein P n=1 Tax=Mannheimia TaxID=75984 RepID=UPI0001594C02|nr:replication protein P [Mannheimia haemolytica]AWW71177.1 replication protein [Pasteurellaceae bacterium 12565]AGI32295.1 replication protein [Mannheimia haemolytica USDA-ARS-USMARC-183]AGK02136.1 putative bacteriophage replication protein P [Mannheimia haemolytica M42548]AGQ24987.1 hypothetical protein F382_02980 [Mannheimia haemolytica D153]AGQ40555.1 hypothetical protein J451_03285 [Mannheimia haemolytica D174]
MGILATTTQNQVLPVEIVEQAEVETTKIFNRLKATHLGWRANIKSQAEYDNARREWVRLLIENRLTPKEVERGLKIADTDKNPYLPSFGQFLEWCKSIDYAELGLPDMDQFLKRLNHFSAFGFTEIDNFKFRSNAEYWLLTDLYERNRKHSWKDETLRNQAEKALVEMAKRIMSGEQIPPPKPVIEEKKKVPIDPRIQRILDEKKQAGAMQ